MSYIKLSFSRILYNIIQLFCDRYEMVSITQQGNENKFLTTVAPNTATLLVRLTSSSLK